ncbi:hypothetical protein CKAH01_04344 [Colletotrichum kahawae]|uniref:Uncharacterized protein n=1 Tax=Colletotrichum kahawae TaxID=34407 RepID=A0AAE0D8E5_COLKA|nr:hypothetical protein CKAH01_04344 [Colletotrichum kahawae]
MENDPAAVLTHDLGPGRSALKRSPLGSLRCLPPFKENSTLVGIRTGPLQVQQSPTLLGILSTSPHLMTDPPPDTLSLPRNAAAVFVFGIPICVSTCCCLHCRILPASTDGQDVFSRLDNQRR